MIERKLELKKTEMKEKSETKKMKRMVLELMENERKAGR